MTTEGPSTLLRSEHAKNVRNIVVCIDGTSNQFGQNSTNMVKLFTKIDLETTHPEQYAYHSSGIGTRLKSLHIFNCIERAVSDKFDMAVGWNMEEIVKDVYGWLARTYQKGDQIYLFDRFLARCISSASPCGDDTQEHVFQVGLIRTPTEKQIGMAYDHYEAIRSGKPKTRQIAREFKNTFSWKDLRVHFIGVCPSTLLPLSVVNTLQFPRANGESLLGGKNRPGKSHQAGDVLLLWMCQEVAANGLMLGPTDIVWVPDNLNFSTSNSMTSEWRAIEYMPIKHQVPFSGAGDDALQSGL
ncbi:hypothetical protein HD554DRAFT_2036412 [Boletus coccyginus]|nr:hypothetical protein HD554DRAFT_2036412 [Boletus coccyginus]